MPEYLGPHGSLMALKSNSMDVTKGQRSNYVTLLGGGRYEQRSSPGKRSWAVGVPISSPSDLAGLEMLERDFFGPPPWRWVPRSAQLHNLFSPGQALLEPGTYSTGAGITQGGAGTTADGIRFGRSLNVSGGVNVSLHYRDSLTDRLPVVPGIPVTASVYASGSASIRIDWTTSTGVFISNTTGATSAGSYTRRTHTATPPANAAGAQVVVVGATGLTLPASTWTTSVQPWAAGRGCPLATVDGLSESIQRAHITISKSIVSFTVEEL